MIGRAVEKYIRMSPRKMRYVMEPLRQRTVAQALNLLAATNRRACKPLAKAIASAFANARQLDPTIGQDQALISRLTADGGPQWKRFRAAAFGRAVRIRKPTTHITVELDRVSDRKVPEKPAAPSQPASAKKAGKPGQLAGSSAAASAGKKPSATKTRKGAA